MAKSGTSRIISPLQVSEASEFHVSQEVAQRPASTGSVGSRYRGLLAGVSLVMLVGCGESGDEVGIPAPETGLQALSRQLDIASLAGPVALKWDSCPGGASTSPLPPHIAVQQHAFERGRHPEGVEPGSGMLTPTLRINNAVRYLDEHGRTAAWCGTSMGPSPNDVANVPAKGTIIVMPHLDPNCPTQSEPGYPIDLQCLGDGREYDPTLRGKQPDTPLQPPEAIPSPPPGA